MGEAGYNEQGTPFEVDEEKLEIVAFAIFKKA